jgi:hypothetical protein
MYAHNDDTETTRVTTRVTTRATTTTSLMICVIHSILYTNKKRQPAEAQFYVFISKWLYIVELCRSSDNQWPGYHSALGQRNGSGAIDLLDCYASAEGSSAVVVGDLDHADVGLAGHCSRTHCSLWDGDCDRL